MGCFVYGQSDSNQKAKDRLLSAAPSETEEGRVLLYICPECGDIGCGAYAARIRKQTTTVEWHDFAYENGYEAGRSIPEVGPFIFDAKDYERVISKAASAA